MELADFEETARRCETRGLSSTPSPSTRRPGASIKLRVSIKLGTMVMKIPLLLPLLSLVFRVEPIVRVRLTQM